MIIRLQLCACNIYSQCRMMEFSFDARSHVWRSEKGDTASVSFFSAGWNP